MAAVRSSRLTALTDEGMLPFAYDEPEQPPPSRPRTRADCVDGPRPCPWISCRYHLAHVEEGKATTTVLGLPLLTDAERGGADEAAWVEDVADAITEMTTPSCALDVAAADEETLETIGDAFGVTRERIRQLESHGLKHLRHPAKAARLR